MDSTPEILVITSQEQNSLSVRESVGDAEDGSGNAKDQPETIPRAPDLDTRERELAAKKRTPAKPEPLCADARGRDCGVREELAAGVVLRSGSPLSGANRKRFAHFETYRF
jgi:hypothetical protein